MLLQHGVRECLLSTANEMTGAADPPAKKQRTAVGKASNYNASLVALLDRVGIKVTLAPSATFSPTVRMRDGADLSVLEALRRLSESNQGASPSMASPSTSSRGKVDVFGAHKQGFVCASGDDEGEGEARANADGDCGPTRGADLEALASMDCGLVAASALITHLGLDVSGGRPAEGSFEVIAGGAGHTLHYDVGVARALNLFDDNNDNDISSQHEVPFGAAFESLSSSSIATPTAEDDNWDLLEGEGAVTGMDEDGEDVPPHGSGGGGGGSTTLRRKPKSSGAVRSVFGVINVTRTGGGARLLRRWLRAPLGNAESIEARLDSVSRLVVATRARCSLRDDPAHLLRCPDLDKIG